MPTDPEPPAPASPPATDAAPPPRGLAPHWQILIALLLAVAAGLATSPGTQLAGVELVAAYDFVGRLFMNALKMLIVPLVTAAIITGVGAVGGAQGLGRLGGRAFAYYFSTSLLAILTGLLFVNLIAPGVVDGEPARDRLGLAADTGEVAAQVEGRGADVVGVFLRLVPDNIVAAAADGQMLGLIFFSLLFGYFVGHLPEALRETQKAFWAGVFEVMLRLAGLVMRFAPLGVFALVAKAVAVSGVDAFRPLAAFFLTVLLGLGVHFFITLPLLVGLVGRVNPLRHYRAMAPALLTAFSTASSAATLPVTLESLERRAGVSNRVASLVLPLGATVNMDGTALYECVVALFIAQAYGLELSVAQQFLVVALALVTSIGVAGIPAASLVAITVILTAIGLPAEAVGLVLAVDRVLDMARTAVNVFSDASGTVILARLEGERGVLADAPDRPGGSGLGGGAA